MASPRTFVAALTFLGLFAPSALAHAETCAGFSASTRTGDIAHEEIDEASGLAASWRHEGLLWTHNDSGGGSRLFLMKQDGTHVATVKLSGISKATDWEDMAVGPCAPTSDDAASRDGSSKKSAPAKTCVYVADIGDNRAKRKEVVIHRFAEPALPETLPADVDVKPSEHLWFRYPGGPRDAEAVMVHPKTAAIYVIDKRVQGNSGVYRIPRPAPDTSTADDPDKKNKKTKKNKKNKPALAVEVGQLRLSTQTGFGSMVTAADISPDGTEFTVRTYLAAYTFCAVSDDFESAVGAEPVPSSTPFMIQSEAVAYDRSGQALWVTSERRPSPLYRMERKKE